MMNRAKRFLFLLAALGMAAMTVAVEINPRLLNEPWDAKWIRAADNSDHEYGVYYFRKTFDLEEQPDRFVTHVSGDCRYKLYVNGELVSIGPAAGDYFNWNFESIDIAEHLRAGRNVLAAQVWNGGDHRPEAQISYRTGFILQGDGEREAVVNTGTDWRALRSAAHRPVVGIGYRTYYVSGPGEAVDLAQRPDGWNTLGYDDSHWAHADEVPVGWPRGGKPKGARDAAGWMLVPRSIPFMELQPQRYATVRRSEGPVRFEGGFPQSGGSVAVPANSRARFLLDQGTLTNAYSRLTVSGGEGAAIELTYAEALFEGTPQYEPLPKGHRDEVEGKQILGRRDRLISSGGDGQSWESMSYRTFRYVEVSVETGDEPLRIDDLSSVFIGYPFAFEAQFSSDRPEMAEMLEIGWRTARLCAVETYMDCPYYEQLQYIGDTRIQALVSLYNSGDDRLLRNALNLMDQSRIAEGVTMSRHPSKTPQIITPFSLWYIGMLHDYWRYGSDAGFVAEKLNGAREVLRFFEDHQGPDGRLKRPPYWLFTDWVVDWDGWDYGEPPFGSEGESASLDLQLLWAFQVASELEAALGMEAFARRYERKAEQLARSIRETYWDDEDGLLRDTAEPDAPISQHANALAILTGVTRGEEARELALRLEDGEGMAPASIYFRYYLHLAMAEAGLGDRYLDWLDKWRENIAMGLTTWAEKSEVESSRSDCHAWGSSPNIEFFRIVLGIDSAAPGFSEARIEPKLGELERASGSIPHPLGTIEAAYAKEGDAWTARIVLPKGVDGTLIWEGESYPLAEGVSTFRF